MRSKCTVNEFQTQRDALVSCVTYCFFQRSNVYWGFWVWKAGIVYFWIVLRKGKIVRALMILDLSGTFRAKTDQILLRVLWGHFNRQRTSTKKQAMVGCLCCAVCKQSTNFVHCGSVNVCMCVAERAGKAGVGYAWAVFCFHAHPHAVLSIHTVWGNCIKCISLTLVLSSGGLNH